MQRRQGNPGTISPDQDGQARSKDKYKLQRREVDADKGTIELEAVLDMVCGLAQQPLLNGRAAFDRICSHMRVWSSGLDHNT